MTNKRTCFGAGLVALDVILNGSPSTLPKLSTGGSCGNVLSILSYLQWSTYPVARLGKDLAGEEILNDLKRWNVRTDFLSQNKEGSSPIIIHRILKDKAGKPIHRFEFRHPETKAWLPSFKAITKNLAAGIIEKRMIPQVFYFDRMNPGTFELVSYFKSMGSIIYFEPSSAKDVKLFEKFLGMADIIKFSSDRIPDYKERYTSNNGILEIETLGSDGLRYRCAGGKNSHLWNLMIGFKMDEIQDAAGAGDWCSAGIIAKLCFDAPKTLLQSTVRDIENALNYGQALGALNCLYDGARGLMYHYTFAELSLLVDNFISQKSGHRNIEVRHPSIDISTTRKFSELSEIS